MSTRKKSKDPGRRRASLAGDVRDKERAPAATSSMGRTGQKGDLPSAIAKRAAAQLPGTQREGKNQGRRRSLRNNTAQSVVSDSGAASNAGLAGASQRSAKELIVSGEQTGLRKRTSVTERDFAMEQPGSSKESMKTPHAGAMERRGEAAHDGITEEPAQTGHAVIMKQSGVVVPTGPTFQPVASQSAGAVAETGNTELLAPSTQSGFTGPLAKSHSLRRGSQKSRDSFISTTSQAANVTEDVEWDGDEATNSQSMAIDYPERQSLHPTGPLYGKTLTPKASSPSSFTRETLKALSTLLCSHSPTASTERANRKQAPTVWCTESSMSKVAATMLLIVALLTLAFLLREQTSAGSERRTYCTTKGCLTHKALIEKQLDRGVDPCDDFYAHVCNRWKPEKEFSELTRSALSGMVVSWLSYLPTTLSKGMALLPVGRKAAAMFNSCMTETGVHVNILKKFMSAHGLVWPEEPDKNSLPASALLDLAFNWNVNLWFTLSVLPGVRQSERRRIFMQPNNLLPLWKAVHRQIPKPYFRKVYTVLFKMFANGTRGLPDEKEITAVYDTLQQVFDTLAPSCPCKPRTPGLFTLKNIDKVSSIPIAKHVQDTSNLVLGIKPPVTSDDLILLSDLSLLTGVFRLIDTLNDRDVVRHLSWLFVQAYGAVADPTAVLLLLHGSKLYAERQRPLFCASQVEASYQLLVAALTSVASFSPEQRRFIEAHLVAIVETAIEKILASTWLDSNTSRVAVRKLENVRTILWPAEKFLEPMKLEKAYESFPESAASFIEYWIETRRRQRALFGTDAAAEELLVSSSKALPYARYTHVLNQLSMPLGALALPLYCPEGTKGMLHGGLLYLYAQALVGALDSDGVRVDPQGNIGPSWLGETSRKAFEQRTFGCLPNSGNIFPEIPAMEVAYASFKRQHQRNDSQLSEELTEEKVFFITACMITCAMTPADNVYGGDCNKAVMNFAPFAEAFQCAPGSNMNPERKCTFFD